MKTRILSIVLVVVMLFSTVAMTGCSAFLGENFKEELGDLLSESDYKGLTAEVEVTEDEERFLEAYAKAYTASEKDRTELDNLIKEFIATGLRTLSYTDDESNTVLYKGQSKAADAAALEGDDIVIYYYAFAPSSETDGTVQTNVKSAVSAYELGTGSLLGNEFDTAVIAKGVKKAGSLDVFSGTELTLDDIKNGYDALYLNVQATYKKTGDDSTYVYNEYSANDTTRYDLGFYDIDTATLKADATQYQDVYTKELADVILGVFSQNSDKVTLGNNYEFVKTCKVDEEDVDVTFTVVVYYAQKEVFANDTINVNFTSSPANATYLLGDTEIQYIVTDIREYSLDNDFTSYIEESGTTNLVALLQNISSEFTTTSTDKDAIVKEYKEYYEKNYKDSLQEEIDSTAKDAMWTAIVTKALKLDNDNYPKRAVKQCYKELMNNYRYDYVNGSSSTAANFEEYLISTKSAADYEEAKEAVMSEARTIVLEKMVIMYSADVIGIELTKKEYKKELETLEENYSATYQFYKAYGATDAKNILEFLGGKEAIYLAMYFTKIMDTVYANNKDNVSIVSES